VFFPTLFYEVYFPHAWLASSPLLEHFFSFSIPPCLTYLTFSPFHSGFLDDYTVLLLILLSSPLFPLPKNTTFPVRPTRIFWTAIENESLFLHGHSPGLSLFCPFDFLRPDFSSLIDNFPWQVASTRFPLLSVSLSFTLVQTCNVPPWIFSSLCVWRFDFECFPPSPPRVPDAVIFLLGLFYGLFERCVSVLLDVTLALFLVICQFSRLQITGQKKPHPSSVLLFSFSAA